MLKIATNFRAPKGAPPAAPQPTYPASPEDSFWAGRGSGVHKGSLILHSETQSLAYYSLSGRINDLRIIFSILPDVEFHWESNGVLRFLIKNGVCNLKIT